MWDAPGNEEQLVEPPADAPVNRVIAVLASFLDLSLEQSPVFMRDHETHAMIVEAENFADWIAANQGDTQG